MRRPRRGAVVKNEAGRAYLTAIHGLRSALSREMDAVQEGKPPTDTVAQQMVRVIDARQGYAQALQQSTE